MVKYSEIVCNKVSYGKIGQDIAKSDITVGK